LVRQVRAIQTGFALTPKARERFDRLLEQVLDGLPPSVRSLLDEVPLHVEDYPSPEVMKEMGLEYRDELCGLFSGVALTERSVEQPGRLPDMITIYREGIWAQAADDEGHVIPRNLKEEIRTTILHELAHFHGLNEDELTDLGYD
jgi:predicted Zn-dependent protease with MMP-like domain